MRYAAFLFALLVLVAGGVPAVAGAGASADSPALERPPQLALQQTENETPQTAIIIDVDAGGNATWNVVTYHKLQSEEDVRAFNQLVTELDRGQANSTADEETFQNFAGEASEATGREMEIRSVNYDGAIRDNNTTGVLNMSFTWTNFAEETDDGLRVGDVFKTSDGGTWFPRLEDEQKLVIRTPQGYTVDRSFSASTSGRSLVVDEPRDFTKNPIYVVYERDAVITPGPGGGLEGFLSVISPPVIAGVGVVVVLVVAGVWYLRQHEERIPQPSEVDGGPHVAGPAAAAGSVEGVDGDAEEAADGDDVDLSLLSDEERVEHLLEEKGGRMRQADIVKETGWSDAKVSQLLSGMSDSGRVEKLRIGRENLISLPSDADDDEE